jgi:hypothetical protein
MNVNDVLDSLYAMYEQYRKVNPLIAIGIQKSIKLIKFYERLGN